MRKRIVGNGNCGKGEFWENGIMGKGVKSEENYGG